MQLEATGLSGAESVVGKDVEELERIVEEEIPKLRRMASPARGMNFGGGLWGMLRGKEDGAEEEKKKEE